MISVSFSLVLLFSTGPYLRWCQANKFAALFGFQFTNVLWVGLNISDLVLSSFIYFFYLTLTRCLKAGVQGSPTQRPSLTFSLTFLQLNHNRTVRKSKLNLSHHPLYHFGSGVSLMVLIVMYNVTSQQMSAGV